MAILDGDWEVALQMVAGIELDPIKVDGVYVVNRTKVMERIVLIETIQSEIEKKLSINEIMRRLQKEDIISEPRMTSRKTEDGGKRSFQVHSLNQSKAKVLADELWNAH